MLYGLLFFGIAAVMAYAGINWWGRAQMERMRDLVVFPFLWNFYYAFISIISGAVGTALVEAYFPVVRPAWVGYCLWGVLSLVGWFVWRGITLRLGRTVLHWGPGVELAGRRH